MLLIHLGPMGWGGAVGAAIKIKWGDRWAEGHSYGHGPFFGTICDIILLRHLAYNWKKWSIRYLSSGIAANNSFSVKAQPKILNQSPKMCNVKRQTIGHLPSLFYQIMENCTETEEGAFRWADQVRTGAFAWGKVRKGASQMPQGTLWMPSLSRPQECRSRRDLCVYNHTS